MSGFFSIDGPFYKFGSWLGDIIILSLLWLVCSIPIVTIGLSTGAAFYVMSRRIANKDCFVVKDFFTSFRQNIRQGLILGVIFVAFFFIIYYNFEHIAVLNENMRFAVFLSQCLVLFLGLLVVTFIFPMLSRFESTIPSLIKTSFFMSVRHLPTSIACILALVLVVFTALASGGAFFLFAPGLYILVVSPLIMRVFKKYRPEIDAPVDYEAIHARLLNGEEPIFSDSAGRLIEQQIEQESKKVKKGRRTFSAR